jgi:hypothetical protein
MLLDVSLWFPARFVNGRGLAGKVEALRVLRDARMRGLLGVTRSGDAEQNSSW